ncbi:hypothetical protein L596_018365 [Steinernema carpocapsae]|uniref:Uncharacterized protein n=1 Tax=Steinernema carpocapsae TaxID=34508 RepID=A0A4U5N4S4_STECR|nr:hypothetical protein L596_018365 [Steinernema carpocapsae]
MFMPATVNTQFAMFSPLRALHTNKKTHKDSPKRTRGKYFSGKSTKLRSNSSSNSSLAAIFANSHSSFCFPATGTRLQLA